MASRFWYEVVVAGQRDLFVVRSLAEARLIVDACGLVCHVVKCERNGPDVIVNAVTV